MKPFTGRFFKQHALGERMRRISVQVSIWLSISQFFFFFRKIYSWISVYVFRINSIFSEKFLFLSFSQFFFLNLWCYPTGWAGFWWQVIWKFEHKRFENSFLKTALLELKWNLSSEPFHARTVQRRPPPAHSLPSKWWWV